MPSTTHSKKRRQDDEIRDALRFIFNLQNVQLLSWGSKSVRLDQKLVTLPAVVRRKTTERLFRDYKAFSHNKVIGSTENPKPLGRSAFLQICESVTRRMQKRKSTVDYILGSLVYDNQRVARSVIKEVLYGSERHEMYLNQIDAVEEFIKCTYLEHIGIDSDVAHDQSHALSEIEVGENVPRRASECLTCMTPLQVIENTKADISNEGLM